jgi:hypothetical protein
MIGLDLAKLSFRSVTDSVNFTQLYDLFKIKANRDELNDFLRTKGWDITAGQSMQKSQWLTLNLTHSCKV